MRDFAGVMNDNCNVDCKNPRGEHGTIDLSKIDFYKSVKSADDVS